MKRCDRRNEYLIFRVSQEDKRIIKRKANEMGVTISAYVREKIIPRKMLDERLKRISN